MAYILADNIISPLGNDSASNYQAIKAGKSGLKKYAPGSKGIPEGFVASLLSDEQLSQLPAIEDFSRMERMAFASAQAAIQSCGIDVKQSNVLFILSSTKGAIEDMLQADASYPFLGDTAKRLANRLGFTTEPIVVCNACISGLAALILANRLLQNQYDYAVVCGVDSPSQFIISGFQSLKALSSEPCRPFDMERFGLNLGEAAATIVLGKQKANGKEWNIKNGYVKNDAYHISAPSKTADGLHRALQETLNGEDAAQLAFINAHGTATLFNDQMESVAVQRAGLSDTPVNALKGYFGHTLGAAGILETILCMKAAEEHLIIGTRGFEELGVSGKMNISSDHRPTDKSSFVKMLSGFGGCNATVLVAQEASDAETAIPEEAYTTYNKTHRVHITPEGVSVNGKPLTLSTEYSERDLVTRLYKLYIDNYPKFYKMDGLSKLGFVASELLLRAENRESTGITAERAIVLCNHSSSYQADKKYLNSIEDKDNYFPSPSIFVYTLPNIVTGEIAIRNGYQGETSFYILPEKDEQRMADILGTAFMDKETNSAIAGWLDYEDENHYEADLFIAERKTN